MWVGLSVKIVEPITVRLCPACRCHSCILAARSDYFAALLKRSSDFQGDTRDDTLLGPLDHLPIIPLSELRLL